MRGVLPLSPDIRYFIIVHELEMPRPLLRVAEPSCGKSSGSWLGTYRSGFNSRLKGQPNVLLERPARMFLSRRKTAPTVSNHSGIAYVLGVGVPRAIEYSLAR